MDNIFIKETVFTTNTNEVTITYETDLTLKKIELSRDNSTWIPASSFNQTSATFDISSWENGTYSSCKLKVSYANNNANSPGTGTNPGTGTTPGTGDSPGAGANPGSFDANGAYVIDDFTGNQVDPGKWSYELGYVRNGEIQRYTSSNAQVSGGILALRGLKDSNGNWTSSSIISKGKFAFMYGKIEARIKPCNYNGAFGAFWTLGDSFEFHYNEWGAPDTLGEWWAWCGEFDVMEFYSGRLTCGVFFNDKEEKGRVWYNNYATDDWHIFAMEWHTDGNLIFTIDGNVLSSTGPTNNRAFHIPHYILLNQAIGASGGTPDSNCTEITQYVDWVKYYPVSSENVVINSSDFKLVPSDFEGNHCVIRVVFNDNCINKALTWHSSNTNILVVHSGLVTAVSSNVEGTATITATSHSGVSKSINLTAKYGKIVY